MQKSITGYGTSTESDKWAFIASPLAESTAPTAIDNMVAETATEYDLYRFNQSAAMNDEGHTLEWENYKEHEGNAAPGFSLENGRGYLYANKENVDLIFKGTFNENDSQAIDLIYDAGKDLAGWNLVGNPFPVAATVTGRSYYVMDETGTGINPESVSAGGTIEACTGIMVKAEENETEPQVTFTRATQQSPANQGTLQIAVAQNNIRSNAIQDKAIVSFNEGDQLGKFYFGIQNANIYIPQNGKEYAIACSNGQGEMPVNFKASQDGQYTISINPEDVEMNYLHLIDNMTGADVDLLAATSTSSVASYTFTAKTTDYESRFKLVFSTNDEDGASTGSAAFAFISNGNIIINGEGTLQVVDVMGRVVVSVGGHTRCVPTAGMPAGVYVLRLIEGNNIRTQKVVVK